MILGRLSPSRRWVLRVARNAANLAAENLIGPQLLRWSTPSYKRVEALPKWLEERRIIIGLMRTNKQKKSIAEDLLRRIPSHNYDLQLRYRNKTIGWNYKNSDIGSMNLNYGPMEAIVYSDLFMPGRFLITKRVLNHLKELDPSFQPKRVLDFGCGPSTAYAAIVEVWGGKDSGKGMHKYVGVDPSQSMIDAAKIITRNGPVDCVFWNKSADVLNLAKSRGDRFDLVILTFTLSEMQNDSMRAATTQLMTELLDLGGHLVIIEAGNPHGSHTVRSARQFVLDVFNFAAHPDKDNSKKKKAHNAWNEIPGGITMLRQSRQLVNNLKRHSFDKTMFALPAPESEVGRPRSKHFEYGVKIVAPCTHDGVCPLGDGVWCSFALRTSDSKDDKYSFVVIQRTRGALDSRRDWLGTFTASDKYSLQKNSTPLDLMNRFSALEKNAVKFNTAISNGSLLNNEIELGTAVKDAMDNNTIEKMYSPDCLEVGCDDLEDNDGGSTDVDGENEEDYLEIRRERHPVLQNFLDGLVEEIDWEYYNPPLYRSEWSRIIRPPLKKRGHVVVDVCHSSQKLVRHTLSKAHVYPIPGMYSSLRKTAWGGLFPALASSLDSEELISGEQYDYESLGKARISGLSNEAAGRKKQRKRKEELALKRSMSQGEKRSQLEDDVWESRRISPTMSLIPDLPFVEGAGEVNSNGSTIRDARIYLSSDNREFAEKSSKFRIRKPPSRATK